MKSHLDEAEAARRGVEHLHWLANSRADALAEEAAAAAQPSPEDVAAVRFQDERTYKVQEHLRVVALAVARNASSLSGPSSRLERAAGARARAAAKHAQRAELQKTTAHSWSERLGRCTACFRGPTRETPKATFLATPCSRRPHQIHESHDLRTHRGLWFCRVCGATGAKRFTTRGLGGPCGPLSDSRRRTLARILAGGLPYHLRAWPEEDEEELTGLELVS